ncbi:alpha/beta fold hydrolase [Acuticoccus sp.]|uniref:alpha/beta fold hydrolase n=1 Tax=Acuticoccus sp. TaxID=1904378 RepID=UPI003B5288B2
MVEVVRTGTLSVAVEVTGPADGRPALLLHGWPDGPRTWDGVLPAIHDAGWRTVVPTLRGFGSTTFHQGEPPVGDLEALGQDVLDLVGGMQLERPVVVGHDWGARAAYIASMLAPERIAACVGVSVGWGTNVPDQPLSLRQTQNYWYHWLFATPRGERMVREDRRALTSYLWRLWAPGWDFDAATFAATAEAFDNPAWPDVTLSSYRVRWDHAPAAARYGAIRRRQADDPAIAVPTMTLHGGADPVNAPETSEGREAMFRGPYERRVLPGLGHFPQREDPDAVARHLVDALAMAA